MSRSWHRRTASTIAGRISPARSGISARASTVWPCSRHSASKRSQNAANVTSLRSKRAQALLSALVELMVRMKSRGSPVRASKPLKASKGLDRITPPKSKKTARNGTAGLGQPSSRSRDSACHMSVLSWSDVTSTRSSSPWNMAP